MVIAIYFDQPGKMSYPFDNDKYYQSYKAFTVLCAKKNTTVAIVREKNSYIGDMRFTSAYQFVNDELVYSDKPFAADIIYLKGVRYTPEQE